MQSDNLKLTVMTDYTPEGIISQRVKTPWDDTVMDKTKHIMDTREQHVRDALIALGWWPPVDRKDPRYKNLRWYEIQRLEFISRHLAKLPFITRENLMNHFGLSVVQAQNDLRKWAVLNPGQIEYDELAKKWKKK